MHGCGNDYIYIDCLENKIDHPGELAVELSDRHFGVGSDGLVLVLPSSVTDFKMRIFNPDGSEAECCGSALRCFAKYVYDNNLLSLSKTDKTQNNKVGIETLAGIRNVKINFDRYHREKIDSITVNMGSPSFDFVRMNKDIEKMIDYEVSIGENLYRLTYVSVGNPHVVIFTKDLKQNLAKVNVKKIGQEIENYSELFPNKVNVEFVEIIDKNHINMRVWERGAGETLSCGTGTCAVVAASVINSLCDRKVTVKSPGGELNIDYKMDDNSLYMTGQAVKVFDGNI